MSAGPIEALLFDVQGTATDFHTTVCTAAADIARDRFPDVDWAQFINGWRAAYFRATSTRRTAADRGERATAAALPATPVETVLRTAGVHIPGCGTACAQHQRCDRGFPAAADQTVPRSAS